jgi:hypothetical protein
MKDFTFQIHRELLESLLAKGYSFITFLQYIQNTQNSPLTSQNSPLIILRHDVEQRYENALKFAQIQHQLGIKGTYYFRILPKCFQPKIVKQIADLGHEIGYHYDDLAQCKGDYQKAIARFEKNLNTLREIAPVQTICMDGSPLSKYDNKDLWKSEGDKEKGRQGDVIDNESTSPSPSVSQSLQSQKSFQDFGIIGEPYFNTDFNKVFYLTDTGRKWDGWKTSVRDKVPQQKEWEREGLVFHSTEDIIRAVRRMGDEETGRQGDGECFPNNVMFTFHPQRWTEGGLPWFKELVLQNAKNFVKGFMVK